MGAEWTVDGLLIATAHYAKVCSDYTGSDRDVDKIAQ
jgi:hypothetical protein